MKRKDNSYQREIAYALSLISQIGWNMVVTVGLGVFIGRFLDNIFGTSPILLIVMIIISVIAAFKNLYMLTERTWKESEKNDD